MRKRFVFLLCVFFTFHVSFAQSFINTKWILVSIDDLETGKSTLVESLVQASLRFSSDSTYSGSICNSFNGKYTYGQPETLTMNEPTASKKFCLSVSELEKRIFSLYVKVTRYKTDNSKLFIFTSSNYRLLYRKE